MPTTYAEVRKRVLEEMEADILKRIESENQLLNWLRNEKHSLNGHHPANDLAALPVPKKLGRPRKHPEGETLEAPKPINSGWTEERRAKASAQQSKLMKARWAAKRAAAARKKR